jgi:hypothetical protein
VPDCYHVRFDGPLTAITESPDGPWPRWEMARAAAIQHIEETLAECQATLGVLRRAANFHEYRWLVEEREALVATV